MVNHLQVIILQKIILPRVWRLSDEINRNGKEELSGVNWNEESPMINKSEANIILQRTVRL